MASWDSHAQHSSPIIKFDNSPAESFLSVPGDMYPSLFESVPVSGTTLNPQDVMTPRSFTDEKCSAPADSAVLLGLAAGMNSSVAGSPPPTAADASSPAPSGEKKPVKKRKSWGQVLPEPKTNLPPRKRAKTEDEKEQRRVERVLRNRRAAQSSRERKRLEVEALELRNQELENRLRQVEKTNALLFEQLAKFQRSSGVSANPLTLSQELFSSKDGHAASAAASLMGDLVLPASTATVNPASLSPELNPVADAASPASDEHDSDAEDDYLAEISASKPSHATTTTAAPAARQPLPKTAQAPAVDLTQHPAEMLYDLQCQQSTAAPLPRSWAASRTPWPPALLFSLQLNTLLLTTASAILSVCRRPLTQIAMSLRAGSSLPPTPSILKTIIWLVTRPAPTSTSTSTTTSTTRSPPRQPSSAPQTPWTRPASSASPPTTLRLRSLRKLLTSSPHLARPLQDATLEALRLVSDSVAERRVFRVEGEQPAAADGSPRLGAHDDDGTGASPWLPGASLPSREILLTLLWTLRVEERRGANDKSRAEPARPRAGSAAAGPVLGARVSKASSSSTKTPAKNYILRVVPKGDAISLQRKRGAAGPSSGQRSSSRSN